MTPAIQRVENLPGKTQLRHGPWVEPPQERVRLAVLALYLLVITGYPATAVLRVALGFDPTEKLISFSLRALILASAVIAFYFFRSIRRSRETGYWRGVLFLFWVMYLVRVLYDTTFATVAFAQDVNFFWYAIGVTAVPMLGFYAPPNRRELRIAAVLSTFVMGAVCAGTLLLPGATAFREDTGRMGLETLNPISLGHAGVTLTLLASYGAYSSLLYRRTFWRVASVLGVPLGMYIVWVAGSRGPVVALLACFAVLAWWITRVRRRGLETFALAATSVGLLIIGAQLFVSSFGEGGRANLVERTQSDAGEIDSYVRTIMMRDALEQFAESPLVGSGMVEQNSRDYPHNVAVEAFMALGIVGGVAFLWLNGLGIQAVGILMRNSPHAIWVALLFLQFLVASFFSGAIWGSYSLWCTLVAILSLSAEVRLRPSFS